MENEEKEIIAARKIAADLIQKVLDGHITVQEARDKWPSCGGTLKDSDELMATIYCLLDHWRDDEDIRTKDERYAKWQKNELKKMIRELMS